MVPKNEYLLKSRFGDEKSVEQFLDRIADAETPSVIAAYEKRINKLEAEKIVITEKMAHRGRPVPDCYPCLRKKLDTMSPVRPSRGFAG